jgi:hypothetical protein
MHPDMPAADKLQVGLRPGVLSPQQRAAATERIVTRCIRAHALHCGITEAEAWARRWLSGEDRTAKSAWAAMRALRITWTERAAWEAGWTRAAWGAAWTAAEAAAHDGLVRALAAKQAAAGAAEWSAMEADGEAGAALERERQVSDVLAVLDDDGFDKARGGNA